MYDCDRDAVVSKELIFKVLDELPGYIGMHKITEPQIIPYAGNGSLNSFDKGGISAFVLIAESHITIHTFKAQRHVFIDIFSCKDFDVDKAVGYLTLIFKPKRIEKNLFMRGKHFSKDLGKTTMVIRKQRAVKAQSDIKGKAMTNSALDI
jgi:S-adenosylmethionine decarboxylase